MHKADIFDYHYIHLKSHSLFNIPCNFSIRFLTRFTSLPLSTSLSIFVSSLSLHACPLVYLYPFSYYVPPTPFSSVSASYSLSLLFYDSSKHVTKILFYNMLMILRLRSWTLLYYTTLRPPRKSPMTYLLSHIAAT